MAGYLDLEGGEPRRSIFLAAKTFDTHLRSCVFVANRCKLPQIAEIATYAGFADPDFRLR